MVTWYEDSIGEFFATMSVAEKRQMWLDFAKKYQFPHQPPGALYQSVLKEFPTWLALAERLSSNEFTHRDILSAETAVQGSIFMFPPGITFNPVEAFIKSAMRPNSFNCYESLWWFIFRGLKAADAIQGIPGDFREYITEECHRALDWLVEWKTHRGDVAVTGYDHVLRPSNGSSRHEGISR